MKDEKAHLEGSTVPGAEVNTYWNIDGEMIIVQVIADQTTGQFLLTIPEGISAGENHIDAQAQNLTTRVLSKLTPVTFILSTDKGFTATSLWIYFMQFMSLYGFIIFYFIILIIYAWRWPEIIYLFSVYTILILLDEVREPINIFVYEHILIDILFFLLAYLLRKLFILKRSKYE